MHRFDAASDDPVDVPKNCMLSSCSCGVGLHKKSTRDISTSPNKNQIGRYIYIISLSSIRHSALVEKIVVTVRIVRAYVEQKRHPFSRAEFSSFSDALETTQDFTFHCRTEKILRHLPILTLNVCERSNQLIET